MQFSASLAARAFYRATAGGTFDQGGNVWEWNEALIDSFRGLRGGSWNDNSFNLLTSRRPLYLPTNQNHFFGFRVATVIPEPSALLLLAVGGLVLAGRRHHR